MSISLKLARYALLILMPLYAWGNECTTAPIEGKSDLAVYSSDKTYLGYVAEERDGTWFAWREGKGTGDNTHATLQEAVAWVCEKKRDADPDDRNRARVNPTSSAL